MNGIRKPHDRGVLAADPLEDAIRQAIEHARSAGFPVDDEATEVLRMIAAGDIPPDEITELETVLLVRLRQEASGTF